MRGRKGRFWVSCLALFAAALGVTLGSCALPAAPADRYAIVIGITHYQNAGSDLTWPADDAVSMKAVLEASGWTVDSILTDSQATRAAMEAAVRGLASKLGPDSTGLVYYSGHGAGLPDWQDSYFIPYDGVTVGGGFNQAVWITPADIDSWMATWPSANKILILDSCNSGGFVDVGPSVDSAPPNYGTIDGYNLDQGFGKGTLETALAQASRLLALSIMDRMDPSILTIAAAGAEEQSYDDHGHEHGAFTWYLLEAATDPAADRDRDRLVTSVEAYSYATAMIKANWNATYGSSVDNGMYMDFLPRISGGSGDIVLYDLR